MDFYYGTAPAPAPARRPWSKEEDKVFEAALVAFPDHAPDRWDRVASQLPGRSPRDAWEHYQALVADVELIERGAIDVPRCWDDDGDDDRSPRPAAANDRSPRPAAANDRRPGKPRGEERRRGIPWSEQEHKLFLDGLEKYGRGDWRNISRFAVRTRTPTQVASHAQKYFIRQANAATRDSKRKSIHDITTP